MMKINVGELQDLIEEDSGDMAKSLNFSKSETVIGEVNGMVVMLTVMQKAEATDVFDGTWTNTKIIEEVE